MSKSAHARHFSKRQSPLNPGCTNGAFYKSPKQGDNIDTSQPIKIEWDTSLDCFSSQGVDIYLYAPYATKSMIHAWGAVSYSSGSFETELAGSYWNSSTAPISLQLGFTESGVPSFLSEIPPGPTFTATFNATDFGIKHPVGGGSAAGAGVTTAPGTTSDSEGGSIFQVIGNAYKNSGLPKGSIAAAVIVPLIAIAIGIAVWVKFQRRKEAEKRKRWSQAVDKRMSMISSDWKELPPNAQSEAIRQSIAIMRNSRASMARMSQIYAQDGRPASTFTMDSGGAAGVGVRKGTGVGLRNPAMGPAQMAQRKSAVSFAADTRFSRPSAEIPEVPDVPKPRPSTETQRGRASRAFHTAISASYPDDFDAMSPTQKGGPTVLQLSRDENVLPALNMMDEVTTPSPTSADFLSLAHSPLDPSVSPIASPPPTHLSPTSATLFSDNAHYSPAYGNASTIFAVPDTPSTPSGNNPFAGFTRGPSNVASPDDMLRAYASRKSTAGSLKSTAGSMRTAQYPALDAPATPEPIIPGPPPGRNLYMPGAKGMNGNRYSIAEVVDEDDVYGGMGVGRAT